MTDSQYKRRDLSTGAPSTPSGWNLRGGAPLEQHWWASALKAQDTLIEQSRRQVCSQQMNGQAKSWLVPETDPDAQVSQTHPKNDQDREVWRYRFSLSPGCYMESRSLYLPSGATQYQGASTWDYGGGFGQVRYSVTWDNGASTDTSNSIITQEPSVLNWNVEPNTINGVWGAIRYGYHELMVPTQGWSANAEANKWSEWSTITVVLNHRGSPRTIHTTITERPRLYVDTHNNSGEASAHCYPASEKHPDIRPQTDTDDGATYQERRFGSLRGLDVARRQADRLGPVLFTWSAFNEGTSTDGGNPGSVVETNYPPTPYTNATASKTCIWDTSIGSWAAASPGFAVTGHYALRFAENDDQVLPGGVEATIPVRFSVYAKMSTAVDDGKVYLQTSARSQISMTISGNSYAWTTITGFVECTRDGEDVAINGMIFGEGNSAPATLSVLYAYVQHSDFAEA